MFRLFRTYVCTSAYVRTRRPKRENCTRPLAHLSELTEDVFEEAVGFSTQQYVHESSFNDAAYGKLAMAKLTLEVRESEPVISSARRRRRAVWFALHCAPPVCMGGAVLPPSLALRLGEAAANGDRLPKKSVESMK